MEKSDKKKVPALLLCLLLGGVGAHRFYVGKKRTATLFIILTLLNMLGANLKANGKDASYLFGAFWISIIWVIVDAVRIITGNFTDSQGRALKD